MIFKTSAEEGVTPVADHCDDLFGIKITNHVNLAHIAVVEQAAIGQEIRRLRAETTGVDFARSGYDVVYSFLEEASKAYDSDLVNPYWAFTHDILKFILVKFITAHFHDLGAIRLFDAGAGTGNWARFVMGLGVATRGILFDMNSSMLRIARPKLTYVHGQSSIVEGNLENLDDFPTERSNLILCMHNVVGLGRNTVLILRNLYAYLEDGGLAFIMAMNKCHALNFVRQYRTPYEAARVACDGTVKFKADMPEIFCYTPQEFEAALRNAGFEDVTVIGFPVTVYPSINDTKLMECDTVLHQLKDPEMRAGLLAMEQHLCLFPELAYRGGSGLIAICKKSVTAKT